VERERWRGLERGLGRGGLAEGRVVLGSGCGFGGSGGRGLVARMGGGGGFCWGGGSDGWAGGGGCGCGLGWGSRIASMVVSSRAALWVGGGESGGA